MNPFPDMPNTTDLGDGRRMVGSHDRGHCYEIVEPDGRVSVTILASSPLVPKVAPKPAHDASFHVRDTGMGQEIVDATGIVLARTTDREMAKHICFLLIAYKNIQDRKASGD